MDSEVKSVDVEKSKDSFFEKNKAVKFTILKVYLSGRPFTRIVGPMKIITK